MSETCNKIYFLFFFSSSSMLLSSKRTPLSIIPMSSARSAISERIWLEIKIVFPFSVLSFFINSRIFAIPIGSKPLVGSSNINTSGSCKIALAIPKRCFIPREYFEKIFLSLYGSPTTSNAFFTASGADVPRSFAKISRFSVPVRFG